MMRPGTSRRRGSTMVEFTLIGIPLIFLVVSIFEVGRGMWQYHTLAYSIKAGARYAAVHGQNCRTWPHTCSVPLSKTAGVIRRAAIGIPPNEITVTFTAPNGASTTCRLDNCISSYTTGFWPPSGANSPGSPIRITGVYPFRSAITMLWPGVGKYDVRRLTNLTAASRQVIEF